MASENITGTEMTLLATAPVSRRDADASVHAMVCPRCGAGTRARCRRTDGKPMVGRVHSERNQKLYRAVRASENAVVSGFVAASMANGDSVTVYARHLDTTVDINGVRGHVVARSHQDLDLAAVLIEKSSGGYVVMQVRVEDISTVH